MALHIFAYNLHLKVSHAVCNNHFNQVPLTVNIVNKYTKPLGFMGISMKKNMGAYSLLSQAVLENLDFFFSIISLLGYFPQTSEQEELKG